MSSQTHARRCWTDLFIEAHIVGAVVSIYYGLVFAITENFASEYYNTGVATVLTCLLIFGVLKLFKYLVVYRSRQYNIEELKQRRNCRLIGFGGMLLCEIVPRILVYFIAHNRLISYYCFTVTLVTSIIFYCLFIYGKTNTYVNHCENQVTAIVIGILAQIISLIPAAWISPYYTDENERKIIFLFNFVFIFISCGIGVDFVWHLMGELEWRNNQEWNEWREHGQIVAQNGVQNTVPNLSVEENDKRVECKICFQEYNGTRLPRMLKECGHTVCEGCADKLLKKNNQRHLYCPFCKEVTVVKGPANQLPKNFTIIDMSYAKLTEKNDLKLDCKTCELEYSESRIPRVLKECGHTVCQGCADELLMKNNQKSLFCPLCQEVTIVKGPASLLPKNFTISDTLDERKKKKVQ